MPDRVVPILRDIEQKEHGNSAHFRADFAVLGWERQGQSRFNYLSEQPFYKDKEKTFGIEKGRTFRARP